MQTGMESSTSISLIARGENLSCGYQPTMDRRFAVQLRLRIVQHMSHSTSVKKASCQTGIKFHEPEKAATGALSLPVQAHDGTVTTNRAQHAT